MRGKNGVGTQMPKLWLCLGLPRQGEILRHMSQMYVQSQRRKTEGKLVVCRER